MSPSSTPWSYTTNCMLVSLGSRQPGELRPCYGRGASVDGQIKCIGNPVQIKRLSVHVEATLSTSDPHPGAHGRSQCATPLFSRSMTLYDGSQGFAWDAVHRFRLPIPDFLEIEGYGHTFPTPPSFSFWDCGAGCDISYQVTVSMVRKRCGFDYNESCVVDILYLPKTRASKGQYPVWIDSSKKDVSDMLDTAFPAGARLGFTLRTLSSPDTTRHCRPARVSLSRRVMMYRRGGKSPLTRETHVARGHIDQEEMFGDGSTLLTGAVLAGGAGRESSWAVPGILQVEYVLRVCLRDEKRENAGEKVIELATDTASAALVGPALGLQYSALPRDDGGASLRLTGM